MMKPVGFSVCEFGHQKITDEYKFNLLPLFRDESKFRFIPQLEGIYLFWNNEKEELCYIGTSRNLRARIMTHLDKSIKYQNGNKMLLEAILEDPSKFDVLICLVSINREKIERIMIQGYKPLYNRYGLKPKPLSDFFWE